MAVAPACRGRRLRPWRRGRGGGTSPPLLLLPLLLVLLKLACLRRRSSSSILAVLVIAWEPIAILVLLAQPGGELKELKPPGCGVSYTGSPKHPPPPFPLFPLVCVPLAWAEIPSHPLTHAAMGSSGSKPEPPSTSQQVETRLAGNASAPKTGKSGKKICCSCPETKAVRFTFVFLREVYRYRPALPPPSMRVQPDSD